jgi:hypothetical protein
MPRKCLVCESPHLKEIDKALVAGEAYRAIALRCDISPDAVQRHKTNHLPKLLVKAREAGEIVRATSLQERAERILSRVEQLAEKSDKTQDWLPVIKAVELLGKLTGEIQTGTKVAVGVNVVGGVTSPEPNFRTMSNEELQQFLKERGGHPPMLEAQITPPGELQ